MDRVEYILTRLNDPDIDERWKAITEAKDVYDQRLIEPLIERLRDREPELRARAAQSLRLMYHKHIVPALLPLLMDDYPEVRAAAAEGLSARYYREALEPLIDRLSDAEASVRAAAARALGSYYSRRAVKHLLYTLEDEEAEVRCAAVEALTELGQPEAIEPLVKLAKGDQSDEVRVMAIEGLGYLAERREMTFWDWIYPERDAVGRLLELIDDEVDEIAEATIEALARIGDARAVKPLVAMLCDWDEDFGRRLHAVGALGDLGDFRVTPILIATLQDPEPLMRPFAARALAHLCDPAALPELDQLAQDERDMLGQAADEAARHIRYELSWQEFDRVAEYLQHGDHQERSRALQCLSKMDDPHAMELIVKALNEAVEQNDLLMFIGAAKIAANAGEASALYWLARGAEYWNARGARGAVTEAENAAHYIRRKLNGEAMEPYISLLDEQETGLDDEEGEEAEEEGE